MKRYSFSSSLGDITLFGEGDALVSLTFGACEERETELPVFFLAERQIQEYLRGERREFTVPFYFTGTDFQKAVWSAVAKIPYGETWCYDEIAFAVGNPKARQAVGTAVGKNPLPLLIPCHRVIRKDGSLGHYAYGEDVKAELLRLEQKYCRKAV